MGRMCQFLLVLNLIPWLLDSLCIDHLHVAIVYKIRIAILYIHMNI
jgi:hypothetical protein